MEWIWLWRLAGRLKRRQESWALNVEKRVNFGCCDKLTLRQPNQFRRTPEQSESIEKSFRQLKPVKEIHYGQILIHLS